MMPLRIPILLSSLQTKRRAVLDEDLRPAGEPDVKSRGLR